MEMHSKVSLYEIHGIVVRRRGCVYRKLKPGRNDGEARRGSGVNE